MTKEEFLEFAESAKAMGASRVRAGEFELEFRPPPWEFATAPFLGPATYVADEVAQDPVQDAKRYMTDHYLSSFPR